MKIVNWNVEWATPRSARGRAIQAELAAANADLICFTEATPDLLPAGGEVLESESDYGYGVEPRRRKVLLWAREGFTEARTASPAGMPPGRYVEGVTRSSGVRVAGVCIPWPRAHVSDGQRNRRPWEDHCAYLDAFAAHRRSFDERPLLVLGDFNQTLPRTRAPHEAHRLLLQALDGLEILTAGRAGDPPLLDHLAAPPGSALAVWSLLPVLSDHTGWVCELVLLPSQSPDLTMPRHARDLDP